MKSNHKVSNHFLKKPVIFENSPPFALNFSIC